MIVRRSSWAARLACHLARHIPSVWVESCRAGSDLTSFVRITLRRVK